MKLDVLAEAKAIRDALAPLGWLYVTGGPYPHNPTLRFSRGFERLFITIEGDKEGTPR